MKRTLLTERKQGTEEGYMVCYYCKKKKKWGLVYTYTYFFTIYFNDTPQKYKY